MLSLFKHVLISRVLTYSQICFLTNFSQLFGPITEPGHGMAKLVLRFLLSDAVGQ